jgi:hypothetical protein
MITDPQNVLGRKLVSSRVFRSNFQTEIREIEGRSFSDSSSELCPVTSHQILTPFCKHLSQSCPITSSYFTAPETHLRLGEDLVIIYQTYYIPFAVFDLLSRYRSSSCKAESLTVMSITQAQCLLHSHTTILTRQFSRQPRGFIYSITSSISCLPIYCIIHPFFSSKQHSPIETPSSIRDGFMLSGSPETNHAVFISLSDSSSSPGCLAASLCTS